MYLRAGYYQPVVGRFLTKDTYTEDDVLSLHLYVYCGHDVVWLQYKNGAENMGHT